MLLVVVSVQYLQVSCTSFDHVLTISLIRMLLIVNSFSYWCTKIVVSFSCDYQARTSKKLTALNFFMVFFLGNQLKEKLQKWEIGDLCIMNELTIHQVNKHFNLL